MEEGRFCVIWVKDEEKSVLRVLEVLEVEVQSEFMLGWHYIHKGFSSVYNPELPLVQRTTAARSRAGTSADATTQSD